MAATASSLHIEQLEQLWGGPGSAQGSKRTLKLLGELATLASQPNCDGAETCAWELCRLLETGRERDLHTVRTQGGLEFLVTLAMAGVADAAGTAAPFSTTSTTPPAVRASTKTAATRALLAACALPQNRAYLLLTATIEKLAFGLLPAAVDLDSRQEALDGRLSSPIAVSAPPEALLLPLLKVLRLVIATPPVAEAHRKLRADLVVVVLYSGGLHMLRDYCGACAMTLSGAARHQPLLIQYFALRHALLLPLHADGSAACATPLREYLEESGLSGVPEMVKNILFESTQPAGSQPQPTAELTASGIASGLTPAVLKVCRTAIQLLVHVGSLGCWAGGGGGGGGSGGSGGGGGGGGGGDDCFLRRALGAEELRLHTFQLAHLTLSLFGAVEKAQVRTERRAELGGAGTGVDLASPSGGRASPLATRPSGSPAADDAAVTAELRLLLHEVLLLLGLFCLHSPRNAEALRWRWGAHPTMLHRLVELPFRYFCEPRCRQVLLPTLLCAVLHEPVNMRILSSSLSPEHLVTFLKTQSLALGTTGQAGATQAAGATPPPLAPAVLAEDPSELPMVSLEYGLAARVPPALWPACMRYLSERPESPMPGPIDGVEPPPSAVMSEGTAAAALEVEKAGSTTGKKITSHAALATPPPAAAAAPPPPQRTAAPAVPPRHTRVRSQWGDSDEEPETTPEAAREGAPETTPEAAPEAAREGAAAPTLHHADVAARSGATPISGARPFSPSTPVAEPLKSPPFAAPRVVKPLIEQARSVFEPKK